MSKRARSLVTTALELLAFALFAVGLFLAFGSAAGAAFALAGLALGLSYVLSRRA